MATRIVECFSVLDHGCDGKVFPGTVVANFTREDHAKLFAGGWNSVSHTKLVIHDSIEDYDNHGSKEARDKVLAKLTPEERLILGL